MTDALMLPGDGTARRREFTVLLVISVGLIIILLGIIIGLFLTPRALPNWAENVLVSIATVAGLKLGDCISALVQLASGRQFAQMSAQAVTSAGTGSGTNPPTAATGKPGDPVHTQEDDKK